MTDRELTKAMLLSARSWLSAILRGAADRLHSLESKPDTHSDELGSDTIEYVVELASESYKRQVDLDESVWRSLPFFAATFAFVAAIIGRAATDVPAWGWSVVAIVANLLFLLAVLSFGWTLRWFWVVLRRREYEYPADDASVKRYAEDMTAYHAALGLVGADLDRKVTEELRLFMIDQFGSAARTNLGLNAKRLQARSKVLLFILIGFVLAFSCEATIFIAKAVAGEQEVRSGEEARRGTNRQGRRQQSFDERRDLPGSEQRAIASHTTGGAKVALGNGGGELLGRSVERQHPGEAVMSKDKSPKPTPAPPARPVPPELQRVAKWDNGTRNQPKPGSDHSEK